MYEPILLPLLCTWPTVVQWASLLGMTRQALEHPSALDRLDLGLQTRAASLLLQMLEDTIFIMTRQALEHPSALDRLDLGLQTRAASLLLQMLEDTIFIGMDVYTYVTGASSRLKTKIILHWVKCQCRHSARACAPHPFRASTPFYPRPPLGRCCGKLWLAASGKRRPTAWESCG
jgi:hypothetical protein